MLGELKESSIEIFGEYHRKIFTLPDIGRLSYGRLLQIGGPPVRTHVSAGTNAVGSQVPIEAVRQAVALLAGYRRIDEGAKLGPGCWPGRSEDGGGHPSVLCVGPGGGGEWNGTGKLTKLDRPRCRGKLLDFSVGEPWFDFCTLSARLRRADHAWSGTIAERLVRFFGRRRWKNPEGPTITAGLALATWVQAVWAWRPQVALIGAGNSGKTTLFHGLAGLYGNLCVKSSNSTPAALRQAIQASSRVILCDEFESSRYRQEILEMLRLAGRGEKVLRGTAKQQVKEFVLRNIVWTASIEVGLKREPDQNRFIILELLKPEAHDRGKLSLPSSQELTDLGGQALAVAMRYVHRARELAAAVRTHRVAGVADRVIESFAVPAAMLAAVAGGGEAEARELLDRMTVNVRQEQETTTDEAELLQALSAALVDMGRGERKTTSEILTGGDQGSLDHLARYGVGWIRGRKIPDELRGRGDRWLFVAHTVAGVLLKDTPWRDQSIQQILRRLPGAVAYRLRMGGPARRGILLPIAAVRAEMFGADVKLPDDDIEDF